MAASTDTCVSTHSFRNPANALAPSNLGNIMHNLGDRAVTSLPGRPPVGELKKVGKSWNFDQKVGEFSPKK